MKHLITLLFVFILGLGTSRYIINQNIKQHEQNIIIIEQKRQSIIKELSQMQELATAKMTIQKNIQGSKGLDTFLPQTDWDDKILGGLFKDEIYLTIEATVTAGYNIDTIISGLVAQDTQNFTITLPSAQILSTQLTQNTEVYERKLGLLTKGDYSLESQVRSQSIDIITQEAIDGGLLVQAQQNAINTLNKLLTHLGITIQDTKIDTTIDNTDNIQGERQEVYQ